MKLSVVIPCFNEVGTIEQVIGRVRNCGIDSIEIVVVDDFSTDGTRELLSGALKEQIDVLVLHSKNQGKGAALHSGFSHCTGDVVVIQDADLEYDPDELPMLMQPILDGKADVVFGSRFVGGKPHRVLYFWHSVGNALLTTTSNVFTNLNLSDMETCYKMFRRETLEKLNLKEKRFGFEPEVTAKIARLHVPIYEIGISYSGRTYSEGKKIGWKDGVRALWVIVKYGMFVRKI
jgi:glycosyltransferase involved in cell wall biosynthesis